MPSWIDQDQAIQGFNEQHMAQQGVGSSLAGQGVVSEAERAAMNQRMAANRTAYNAQVPGMDQGTKDNLDASFAISQATSPELFSDQQKEAYLQAAKNTPLGDVNDPKERMKAMSFITQDRAGKDAGDQGGSVCAGASIVGAAFLAEGPAGLTAVMKAIEAQDPSGAVLDPRVDPEYAKLKEKMKKDPNSLTVADIQVLQQSTYRVLQENQDKRTGYQQGDLETSGIHNKDMDLFMESEGSAELSGMLKKNGMEIKFVDNDGAIDDQGFTSPDHYVVRMTGKDGKQAVYDPNARRGGQIIDFDTGVDFYNKATQDTIGDTTKPYQ
jgi:hypothetical protein